MTVHLCVRPTVHVFLPVFLLGFASVLRTVERHSFVAVGKLIAFGGLVCACACMCGGLVR